MGGRVFINYRRSDSAAWAGRIHERLSRDFDTDQLFIDVDNIEPGVDFTKVLDEQVATCDVFILIIGRVWLTVCDEGEKRCLDNVNDFVRIEIEAALKREIRVIPMLVDGAKMPRPDQLPDSLKPLALRHAVTVTHEGFGREVQGLVASLKRMAPFSGSPATQPAERRTPEVSSGSNADDGGPGAILLGTGIIAVATLVVVGLIAALIGGPGLLRETWCKNIGTFCGDTPQEAFVESGLVLVESGGTNDNKSDQCKDHRANVCISPSRSDRKLVLERPRFEVGQMSGGVFVDGNPTNSNPIGTSNIGWFVDDKRNDPSQICAIIYARTSACETRVFLSGKLRGKEVSVK